MRLTSQSLKTHKVFRAELVNIVYQKHMHRTIDARAALLHAEKKKSLGALLPLINVSRI